MGLHTTLFPQFTSCRWWWWFCAKEPIRQEPSVQWANKNMFYFQRTSPPLPWGFGKDSQGLKSLRTLQRHHHFILDLTHASTLFLASKIEKSLDQVWNYRLHIYKRRSNRAVRLTDSACEKRWKQCKTKATLFTPLSQIFCCCNFWRRFSHFTFKRPLRSDRGIKTLAISFNTHTRKGPPLPPLVRVCLALNAGLQRKEIWL